MLTVPPERMSASDRLAHDTITDVHRAWLASLPLTLELADGVLAFHGSPTDDLTYLLETVEEDGARPATHGEVLDRLGEEADRPLLLCGHTHLQRAMRLPTGATVVNPGSVGWPARTRGTPSSTTTQASGRWPSGRSRTTGSTQRVLRRAIAARTSPEPCVPAAGDSVADRSGPAPWHLGAARTAVLTPPR